MIMRFSCICVITGLLTGCGSVHVPATRYYKLDIPATPSSTNRSAGASLRIEPFRTSALLRQDRIVYRPSPEEVGFYEYHRWAEPPSDTLTKALAYQLMKRGIFRSIDISSAGDKADFVMRGNIDKLQEVDYMGGVRVQVSISLELEESALRQIIWSSAAVSECAVAKSDVRAVVAAMGQASQQNITRFLTDFSKFAEVNRLAAASSGTAPQ